MISVEVLVVILVGSPVFRDILSLLVYPFWLLGWSLIVLQLMIGSELVG